MRRMLLAILSALSIGASAQITVTAASFPKAGDTLKMAVDVNPSSDLDVATPPGGNQTWDFSNLKALQTNDLIFGAASTGSHTAAYPGADIVLVSNATETYYNVTNTKWENMGISGKQAQFFNLNISTKYSPALTERHAPLNFFDIFQQSANLTLPFSVSQLPDTLFSALPVKPDSLRIKIATKRLEVADAWGTCKIPGGSYPVIRLRRTDYTTTGADIKIGFFWLDLSQLISSGGGALGNLVRTDTTISYHFYNNTAKEEIVVATMNKNLLDATAIRFKNNKTVDSEEVYEAGTANIQAFPNPAVERVRFDCTNLPGGIYTLKIYNIIGRVVWRQNYTMAGNQSIPLNLEKFNKGTYLYSLIDAKGHTVGTKRLVILKP